MRYVFETFYDRSKDEDSVKRRDMMFMRIRTDRTRRLAVESITDSLEWLVHEQPVIALFLKSSNSEYPNVNCEDLD